MTAPAPPPPPSRSTEARDAVADVLRDQVARARLREQAVRAPKDRTPLMWGMTVAVSAGALWFWVAPPAFIRPPPPPPAPPELVDAELRMTVYQAVLRLDAYRDSAGSYPERLEEAFEGPEDVEGFAYQRLGPRSIHLSAARGDAVVLFETGDTLSLLASHAVRVLERIRP